MSEEEKKENIEEVTAPGLAVVLTNLDNLAKVLTKINKTAKSDKLKKSIDTLVYLHGGFEKMKKNYPKSYKLFLGVTAMLDPVGAIKAGVVRNVITAFVNSFGLNPPPEMPQIDTSKPPLPPEDLREQIDRMQILAGTKRKNE
tara:strand:+ start:69 stop:497 length:429 start_codon:yes stop_codon:yes gene_type:complete